MIISKQLLLDKINRTINLFNEMLYKNVANLEISFAVTDEPVAFSDRLMLNYKAIKEGDVWSFKKWDCGWFHLKGEIKEQCNLYLQLDFDGEGCIFDKEGTPIRGITNVSSEFERELGLPGKQYVAIDEIKIENGKIDLWVETGNNDLFGKSYTGKIVACRIVSCNEKLKQLFYDFCIVKDIWINLLENDNKQNIFQDCLCEVASRLYRDITDDEIENLQHILGAILREETCSQSKYYAIGHSHLDLAWLWPIRETKRKAGRTFSTAIANMKKYPWYIYGASQPQQFEWVKNLYPKLFDKLVDAEKGNRLEIQGAMWVEADTNISGGEALIRQCIIGQKFWQENFGHKSNICWLPDVFGFSGALPQILKDCGCKYFMTTKLSWNMVNRFPLTTFNWKGIDGTCITTHIPPEGTYNSSGNPNSLKKCEQLKINTNKNLLVYGIGDGGGGPGETHLEVIKRESNIYGLPKVIPSKSETFFNSLDSNKLDIYNGELYLERHQGTLTSQAKNKYYNRKSENALMEAEFLSVALRKNNKNTFERLWKEVLLYQFHDILPGSSIKRVYDESEKSYEKILKEINNLFDFDKNGLTAINNTNYLRTDYVKQNGDWYFAEIPPYSASKIVKVSTFNVYSSGNSFGNKLVTAFTDEQGKLESIKVNEVEYLASPSLFFPVYHDIGDAWDFYPEYEKSKAGEFKLDFCENFIDGAKAGIKQKLSFGKSAIDAEIYVKEDSPLVYLDISVDWQENEKMLRMDIFPQAKSDFATFDIQFGNIKRSTKNTTSQERAQFEVCAHKWVDVSNVDGGLAVINDCKYGYKVKDGKISVNLLRSQNYPCINQDRGIHEISFALYPHDNRVNESKTNMYAYFINRPIKLANIETFDSLIYCDNIHAVIDNIKLSEDGKGFIARIYNDSENKITANIFCNGTLYKTNMLESGEQVIDNFITLNPYEILSVKVKHLISVKTEKENI